MKIPVFVSSPTSLSPDQEKSKNVIMSMLDDLVMEPRSLGTSDYPKDVPLREVYVIAKHCHGGIILGYEQFHATAGTWKRGAKGEEPVIKTEPVCFPTPWNQLEAGILFGLKLPLLIFREAKVFGGVFDVGTTEVFVHHTPPPKPDKKKLDELKQVFLKWGAEVNRVYYEF